MDICLPFTRNSKLLSLRSWTKSELNPIKTLLVSTAGNVAGMLALSPQLHLRASPGNSSFSPGIKVIPLVTKHLTPSKNDSTGR